MDAYELQFWLTCAAALVAIIAVAYGCQQLEHRIERWQNEMIDELEKDKLL
jgi:hypothetical protein